MGLAAVFALLAVLSMLPAAVCALVFDSDGPMLVPAFLLWLAMLCGAVAMVAW